MGTKRSRSREADYRKARSLSCSVTALSYAIEMMTHAALSGVETIDLNMAISGVKRVILRAEKELMQLEAKIY